jgi:hypothetical protein
MNDR